MFVFRHMEWFFAGIALAIFIEGVIWFFIPEKIIRWLEKTPLIRFRLLGLAGIILSLGALYFILYHYGHYHQDGQEGINCVWPQK